MVPSDVTRRSAARNALGGNCLRDGNICRYHAFADMTPWKRRKFPKEVAERSENYSFRIRTEEERSCILGGLLKMFGIESYAFYGRSESGAVFRNQMSSEGLDKDGLKD